MNQTQTISSSVDYHYPTGTYRSHPSESIIKTRKRSGSLECTCEIGNLKSRSKGNLKYSMCDVCSEKMYSNRRN